MVISCKGANPSDASNNPGICLLNWVDHARSYQFRVQAQASAPQEAKAGTTLTSTTACRRRKPASLSLTRCMANCLFGGCTWGWIKLAMIKFLYFGILDSRFEMFVQFGDGHASLQDWYLASACLLCWLQLSSLEERYSDRTTSSHSAQQVSRLRSLRVASLDHDSIHSWSQV